jgi:hypothetical protein
MASKKEGWRGRWSTLTFCSPSHPVVECPPNHILCSGALWVSVATQVKASPPTLSFLTQLEVKLAVRAKEVTPNSAKATCSRAQRKLADTFRWSRELEGEVTIPFLATVSLPTATLGWGDLHPRVGGTLSGSLPAEVHSGSWRNKTSK